MKVANLLVAFALLALASSFVTAYDPSPLQDFCVGIHDADAAVLVNGKFCKNPSFATIDDFTYSGFDVRGNTSNQLRAHVNLITADLMPGLNTLGVSLARIDFEPNGGLNPPHYHPRGSEVLLVLEGTLYAVAIAALTSQNPGVNTVANAIFGANWPINPEVLTTAFHLDKTLWRIFRLKTG
ncbi:unnamed protein product [Dovyalis caffra]|uniref:Cupin type-1 domain-containing protein n=1 Tax=Dovyalis caffra TaxID=77055 RepID=A0AAV1R8W3_9ROSI|nr:unnamed protein product [Dovyalis caffra]